MERFRAIDGGEPPRRGYANLVRTSHRVAAAIGIVFVILAIVWGRRLLQTHDGLDIASGSNDVMTLMLLILGCFLAFSYVLLRPGKRNVNGARAVAVVWSVALLAALAFSWWVIATANRWTTQIGSTITSAEELEQFVASHPESVAGYDYRIPTGVYLQSFEFLSASNVELSGYVWQFYSDEIPPEVARGIVLPEALEEAYEAHESWRIRLDGGEQIGWYFSGTFRQNFDYRLYPFDRQSIWLRLWSPEAAAAVLLVPDFGAYRDLTPATLPGIDTQFVYGGWDPIASAFSYDLLDYNVDFGLRYGFSGVADPELYFNLAVERDALGPLLEHVVLETAIAVLLFLLLLLMSRRAEAEEGTGFTPFDLTIAAGGLLFAVILDHNALRNTVESQQLIYLEWIPLILDVFIVLVVLSAVLRAQGWRLPFLGYTGDLVPVLAYWPALLGTLLTVTLLVFFY